MGLDFWELHQSPAADSSRRSNTELEDDLEAGCMLFPPSIFTSLLNKSCDGDVEDEPLPALAEKYEIIRLAENTLPVFDHSWLLTTDPLGGVSVVFVNLAYR